MQDAMRAYLELALGLTEASRKRAEKVARDLLGRGEATAAQLQSVVDELMATSRTNREGLARLVRYEVDRALGVVGLATAEEVAELTTRVRTLERELRETSGGVPGGAPNQLAQQGEVGTQGQAGKAAPQGVATRAVAEKAVATKAVAKKAVVKKTAAKKGTAEKTAAKKGTAKRTAKTSRAEKATG